MTTVPQPTTPQPQQPAPVPPAPAPATQQSVRSVWAAVAMLGVCGALYAMHEHPALVAPLGTLGGLLGAAAAIVVVLRR